MNESNIPRNQHSSNIVFETAVFVWKCIHVIAPAYLLYPYLNSACLAGKRPDSRDRRRLRSASTGRITCHECRH